MLPGMNRRDASAGSGVREPGGAAEQDRSEELVRRAKAGDRAALDCLVALWLPRLRRWARGRLPRCARDLGDTSDMVQEVMLNTVKSLSTFDDRGEGAFYAYVRRAVLNRICDEVRRAARKPLHTGLTRDLVDAGASPLERAVGVELLERYEAALLNVKSSDRDLIIASVDLGVSYKELAEALGKPSANAARMALERALIRLACEMARLADPSRRTDIDDRS